MTEPPRPNPAPAPVPTAAFGAGPDVIVVGGGLAGCECAWQLAEAGLTVRLHEQKPHRRSPAHVSDGLAELVCSNSFRSDNPNNAVGLLHQELRRLGSLILHMADLHRVPAGDALAVDRERFGAAVQGAITEHERIELVTGEVQSLPLDAGVPIVVATGPLTSDALAQQLVALTGAERLAFYDAIAPIVDAESVDMSIAWRASRWDKGGADYVNCPLDREAYERFLEALLQGDRVASHSFEDEPQVGDQPGEDAKYFQGCLPVEVVAASGPESLRYGAMKPVGLDDPRTGRWPHAVVQLRAENRDRTAYNLVGFQTKLRYPEQRRVFRLIPGLERAEFLRYGSIHRNTFLDSPELLDASMRLRAPAGEAPAGLDLRFAGQITGVEGYVESTACGLWVGLRLASELRANGAARALPLPPPDTALGALLGHVVGAEVRPFQPTNVHFGLFPALPAGSIRRGRRGKQGRKQAHADRARAALGRYLQAVGVVDRAPPAAAEVPAESEGNAAISITSGSAAGP